MTAAIDPSGLAGFEVHRRSLMGLAYRMLGSRAEAEDVLQDAWLRWQGTDRAAIEEPRHYLGTVVARLCLDRMKSAQARREVYVGPWLPEPVVDEAYGDEPSDLAHDISVALMLLLERLSPLECASFLLHDVFGLEFAEVALALGRGEAACPAAGHPRPRAYRGRAAALFCIPRGRHAACVSLSRRCRVRRHRGAATGPGRGCRALHRRRQTRRGAQSDPWRREGAPLLRRHRGQKNPALLGTQMRAATVNGLPGLVLRETDGSIDTRRSSIAMAASSPSM
jgi:RNA polymerase sigma-70 factor, ECF subfamily